MYREMWERLKESLTMTLDNGKKNKFDDPKSEKFAKFMTYCHVFEEVSRIEKGVTERRREGRRPVLFADELEIAPNRIKTVIFNDPATIVIWKDGSKTVVKCQSGDTYSKETGLALCIAKKFLGNTGNFNEVFKTWIPEEKEIPIVEMRTALSNFCIPRNCTTCPIARAFPNHKCGRGYTYETIRSENEIRAAYKVAFEEG